MRAGPVGDAMLPGWTTPALALLGVLGPFLLARRALRRPLARALVLASLAALAIAGTLAAFEGETLRAADALLAGAIVALAAVGIRRPYALATLALAALGAARALALGISGELLAAGLWAGAVVLAAGLGGARYMRAAAGGARRRR